MSSLEKIGKKLAYTIDQSIKDEIQGEKLIKKLEKEFTDHFNDISLLIEKNSSAFGEKNFRTQLAHAGPLIGHKIELFEHSAEHLHNIWETSNVKEIKEAAECIKKLILNLNAFRKILIKDAKFKTANDALEFFQRMIGPFRNEFFSHLNKEKQILNYGQKLQFSH